MPQAKKKKNYIEKRLKRWQAFLKNLNLFFFFLLFFLLRKEVLIVLDIDPETASAFCTGIESSLQVLFIRKIYTGVRITTNLLLVIGI